MEQIIVGAQYRDRLTGLLWRVEAAECFKDVRAWSDGFVRRFLWSHFMLAFDLVTG